MEISSNNKNVIFYLNEEPFSLNGGGPAGVLPRRRREEAEAPLPTQSPRLVYFVLNLIEF